MSEKINTRQTEHIQKIIEEPLNRLRIEFSHEFIAANVSQSYFEQLLPRIKEIFSDEKLYNEHMENLKNVLSTGDTKSSINLSQEESQFFWGAALAYISSNPEIQQRWKHQNQFTKISESTLWKRIAYSPEMRKEFKATAFILKNSLRNPETRMLWGEPLVSGYPNIGYCFIPEENIIINDMLWSLVAGTKNALPAINHEIAHSQGTIGIPQKIQELKQQFENIRQQIAQTEQTQQNTEEIQKLVIQAVALQQEAKLRFYIYDELENMYANRYAMNVGGNADKLSLNILETCICGTGEQYLGEKKSLEDFKKELKPSQQIDHIKRAARYSFFCNNGLIRDTLEDWHSVGVYPECIVAYDKDGRELSWQDSFKKLRDICDELEKLQPSKILRLLNQNRYTKQMKEMSVKRQDLIMEFFDSFVLPHVKDLIKENVQDATQQLNEQMTPEDLQKLQQQMQNVAQDVIKQNTLRELSSTFQPQSNDEQTKDQQSEEEENQSEQQSNSEGQQSDEKEKQSEQQSDSEDQQSDEKEKQSEQQSDSEDQQSDEKEKQSEQQSNSEDQQSDEKEKQSEQQSNSEGQQSDEKEKQSEQQSNSEGQQSGEKENQSEQQSNSEGQQSDEKEKQSEQQSNSEDQQSDEKEKQSEQQSNSEGQQSDEKEKQSEQQSNSEGQQSGEKEKQSEQQSNSEGQQNEAKQNQSREQSNSEGQQNEAKQNQSREQSNSDGQQNEAKQNQSREQSNSDGQQSEAKQNQSREQSNSEGQQSDDKEKQSEQQSNSEGQQNNAKGNLENEDENEKNNHQNSTKSDDIKDVMKEQAKEKNSDLPETTKEDSHDEELKTSQNIDLDALPPSKDLLSQDQQPSTDKDDRQNNTDNNPENGNKKEKNNHQDSTKPDEIKDVMKEQSEEKNSDLANKTKQFDSIEGDACSHQKDEAKMTDGLSKLLNTKHKNESTSENTQKHNNANSPQSGNVHQISLDEENGQHTDNSNTKDSDKQLSSTNSNMETETSGYKTNKTSDITTGKEKKLGKTGRSNSVSDMLGGMDFPKSRENITISKQELQELIKSSENIDKLALEDFRDKTEAATPQEQTIQDYEEIDDNWGDAPQGSYNSRPTLISRSEMQQSSGEDARFYDKGNLNSYEKIIANHETTILKVRQLLKKIIEQQKMEQAQKSISHKKEDKMELLPTQGADKLSIQRQIDLVKKKQLRDPTLSIKDFERFKNKKQKPKMISSQDVDVPSVDVGILIDGSGSMNGAPFETALTIGCILFEATRKIPEINIYIYMMGQPRPLVIGLPENRQEEIACNLDSVRRGQGGCNDHLTPAVERFLKDVAERKAKEPKSKSGFQHIFSITDGGNNDYDYRDVNKILSTLLDNNPYMTFDSFFIDGGGRNYTKGFILEKRQSGCKRIGFVDNIHDISEMPQKICEMLSQRMKNSKLEKASTNILLTKIIKDSLSKI